MGENYKTGNFILEISDILTFYVKPRLVHVVNCNVVQPLKKPNDMNIFKLEVGID